MKPAFFVVIIIVLASLACGVSSKDMEEHVEKTMNNDPVIKNAGVTCRNVSLVRASSTTWTGFVDCDGTRHSLKVTEDGEKMIWQLD